MLNIPLLSPSQTPESTFMTAYSQAQELPRQLETQDIQNALGRYQLQYAPQLNFLKLLQAGQTYQQAIAKTQELGAQAGYYGGAQQNQLAQGNLASIKAQLYPVQVGNQILLQQIQTIWDRTKNINAVLQAIPPQDRPIAEKYLEPYTSGNLTNALQQTTQPTPGNLGMPSSTQGNQPDTGQLWGNTTFANIPSTNNAPTNANQINNLQPLPLSQNQINNLKQTFPQNSLTNNPYGMPTQNIGVQGNQLTYQPTQPTQPIPGQSIFTPQQTAVLNQGIENTANKDTDSSAMWNRYQSSQVIDSVIAKNLPTLTRVANNFATYEGVAGKGQQAWDGLANTNPQAYADYRYFTEQLVPFLTTNLVQTEGLSVQKSVRDELEDAAGVSKNLDGMFMDNPKLAIQLAQNYFNLIGQTTNGIQEAAQPYFKVTQALKPANITGQNFTSLADIPTFQSQKEAQTWYWSLSAQGRAQVSALFAKAKTPGAQQFGTPPTQTQGLTSTTPSNVAQNQPLGMTNTSYAGAQ